ncbi:MAG: YbaK/EbsC family protein [Bacilli bacterium]|nr:YbaK/EbsC family protein [Bacilli bacterium]
MSKERAKAYLDKYNMGDRIREFDVSSATVKDAAIALNCEEKRIAKTLSFLVDDKPILIVTAGDTKTSNSKYKSYFHTKAKMIPADMVTDLIGHPIGGVCPFGVNDGVEIYLDESLKRFETVFPACGETNNAIELTIGELEQVTNYKVWIDVSEIKE